LKGLAAHYCHRVLGSHDRKFDKTKQQDLPDDEKIYDALFGTSDDSGHIRFHDAWIDPESLKQKPLRKDIMTPHHGDYYSGTMIRTGDNDEEIPAAPTDFDKPNPVSFLSVTGKFYIAVSCDDLDPQNGQQWADFAFEMLENALKEWGIGGKTSAGYGRMTIAGKTVGGSGSSGTGSPKHSQNSQIIVERIEDFKNKKGEAKPCFRADDGFAGFLEKGILPESIVQGNSVELKVHSVNQEGVNRERPDVKYIFIIPEKHSEEQDPKSKRRFKGR
jgi:CRISPR-associated protein Cmr6